MTPSVVSLESASVAETVAKFWLANRGSLTGMDCVAAAYTGVCSFTAEQDTL